jgi:hypothetical protein
VGAVHADDLEKAIHDAIAPLLAELVRIRELLEWHTAAGAPAVSALTQASPEGESAAPAAADSVPTPPAAPPQSAVPEPSTPEISSTTPSAADPLAILRQLLDEYPDDAAAVFFGFHRQHRCAPDYLDRLARHGGLEEAWNAVNRTTVRALLERQHGGLASVAELLGRDTDSLQALVARIGLREHVEVVRSRERDRVQKGSLAHRVGQILFRDRLLQDLGIRAEVESQARQELLDRCASLAGECDDAASVYERLGQEYNLDAHGLERLTRRFDLQRFVADLYQELTESQARPALRRGPRPEANRRALGDQEIETRILRMLLAKRKVGAAHTHIDHLVRTVPTHERGRARAVVDRLVTEGTLVLKVTDNSAEPHVSLAVAAVPQVEQRLRAVFSPTES